eukprot:TRINITY_DN38049_c0_g1_i1.p1 TRINITY_DN38049_c0_g1~~TRINITY_DN38049_c0_g1_i1.p1  ORF type:complete len:375 (+),score=60.51 TRINITY_DN38049_c0_g1_i1:46-1170(+)
MASVVRDTPPIIVTEKRVVDELCRKWSKKSVIGVDTEFMRSDKFFPDLCLIQVSDGEEIALLDPMHLGWQGLASFGELLANPDVTKAIFDMKQDLECFAYYLHVYVKNVTDLREAVLFADLPGLDTSACGYSSLVKYFFDIDLSKTEQRSNWRRRPLSRSQVTYAADDVRYIVEMFERIRTNLNVRNRWAWAVEEAQLSLQDVEASLDAYNCTRLPRYAQLSRDKQFLVQCVFDIRENYCKEYDTVRKWTADDKMMMRAAADGVPPDGTMGNPFWSAVMRTVRNPPPTPDDFVASVRYPEGLLTSVVEKLTPLAATLHVPVRTLIRKKDLDTLLGCLKQNLALPPYLSTGWRAEAGCVQAVLDHDDVVKYLARK